MQIRLGYDIEILCDQPTELLALLDPHPWESRKLLHDSGLDLTPHCNARYYEDSFGNSCLRLTAPKGPFRLRRDMILETSQHPEHWPADAEESAIPDLPDETLPYLLASRYCETDLMMDAAWELFGQMPPGWARVRAIFDHVNDHLTFGYPHARNTRTAAEAWTEQKGVCRDFAHLAITLCRCMNIPARYVNGFLPDVGVPADPAPMDYNAWAEVWIGGQWVTLDARHNQPRIARIPVARGRDATDIPLLHSFGPHKLTTFKVWCDEATLSPHAGQILPAAQGLISPGH